MWILLQCDTYCWNMKSTTWSLHVYCSSWPTYLGNSVSMSFTAFVVKPREKSITCIYFYFAKAHARIEKKPLSLFFIVIVVVQRSSFVFLENVRIHKNLWSKIMFLMKVFKLPSWLFLAELVVLGSILASQQQYSIWWMLKIITTISKTVHSSRDYTSLITFSFERNIILINYHLLISPYN